MEEMYGEGSRFDEQNIVLVDAQNIVRAAREVKTTRTLLKPQSSFSSL